MRHETTEYNSFEGPSWNSSSDPLIFTHISDLHITSFNNIDKYRALFQTAKKLRANFHLLSLSVPFLKVSKGNAVMISSVESKITEKGDFLHALSKSMINSLVENSALELASFGVRVNAVAPGFVNSNYRAEAMDNKNEKYLEMMKDYCLLNKKIVEPEEVADSILFLASDEACFMTGEVMTIDSGFELNHDLSFMEE